MAGYIDNTGDDALFSAYSQGRAMGISKIENASRYAQWSSVLDGKTCDFCSWADMRIFDTTIEPYDPPMHYGCRCLLAVILEGEFTPEPDWGDGPPPSAFPPGTYGGATSEGVPTLVNEPPKSLASTYNYIKPAPAKNRYDPKWEQANTVEDLEKMDKWLQGEMELALGDKYDKDAYDFINKKLPIEFTQVSEQHLRDTIAALHRGDIDELFEISYDMPGLFTTERGTKLNIQSLVEHYQVNQELARAAAEKVYGESVTLYRGIRTRQGITSEWYDTLKAGDLEFSIGTSNIESWSFDKATAEAFSHDIYNERGILFSKAVDVQDITPINKLTNRYVKSYGEEEVVWMNFDGTIVPKSVSELGTADVLEVDLW